jgi:general secretion pathway protein D
MNTNLMSRRFLALSLSICLLLPNAALAGNKGKKNFKEGQRHEVAQQWDLAAQQYALAVAADPNNAEYKLNYLRALQQASLMFIKRGDALNEQGDYASAYSAYRTAFQYDPSNEIAGIKMQRMLDQQKAQLSGHEPVNTTKTANVRPTSDIQFAGKPRNREAIQNNISFTRGAKFKTVMNTLGKQLGLNVVFDDTVKDDEVVVDLTDVSLAKAFDIILMMKKYTFEQIDRRTIIIYPDNPTNKPRYEKLMIKTFYTGNITAEQARQVLTPLIGPQRQMATLGPGGGAAGGTSSSNTLIVKATAQELQLVQDVLDSIDKNKNEVVLDVEIYEVSHNNLLQIGNQIATSSANYVDDVTGNDGRTTTVGVPAPTLSKLGGIGGNFSADNAKFGIQLFNQTAGFLIGLPPTSLTFLQEKGDSKLLNKTQIHVLDGGQNTTKVGRSVPVRVGSQLGFGNGIGGGIGGIGGIGGVNQGTGGVVPGSGINNGGLGGFLGGFGGYGGVDAIQYRDVGLVIKTKPMITNEGYVEIQMDFETSDVVTGANPLNPEFTQRSLNTTARIKDGVTAVVAGVSQDSRGNSRSGVPVLSMVPILGRLFSAPSQNSRKSDIVITVTPHVVRSAGIESKDHLAKEAGVQPQGGGSGLAPKIEDVIYRAQQEEEQERRLIAGNAPPPVATPIVPDAQVASNQPGQPGVNPAPISNPAQIVNASNQTATPAGRSFSNASLVNSGNINTASPSRSQPEAAEALPASSVSQGATSDGAPRPNGDGKLSPELEQAMKEFQAQNVNPETPVPQAIPMASRPSEAYLRQMADWKRKTQAESGTAAGKAPQPAPIPAEMRNEMMPSGPTQKVAPAVPSAINAASARGTQVAFNLSPRPINQHVGKSFTVNVEVNSQAQMTGADVTLKYDASKLQVKSVRDGGMLGAQPELNYELKDKGTLVVHINHARKTPVAASGQLITIEFTALAEGYSQIAVNTGETKVKLPGNVSATAGSASTQVSISRNGVTSATNEK